MSGSSAGPVPGLDQVASHGHPLHRGPTCPSPTLGADRARPLLYRPMKVTEAQPRRRTCGTSVTPSQVRGLFSAKIIISSKSPNPGRALPPC